MTQLQLTHSPTRDLRIKFLNSGLFDCRLQYRLNSSPFLQRKKMEPLLGDRRFRGWNVDKKSVEIKNWLRAGNPRRA